MITLESLHHTQISVHHQLLKTQSRDDAIKLNQRAHNINT